MKNLHLFQLHYGSINTIMLSDAHKEQAGQKKENECLLYIIGLS